VVVVEAMEPTTIQEGHTAEAGMVCTVSRAIAMATGMDQATMVAGLAYLSPPILRPEEAMVGLRIRRLIIMDVGRAWLMAATVHPILPQLMAVMVARLITLPRGMANEVFLPEVGMEMADTIAIATFHIAGLLVGEADNLVNMGMYITGFA